MKNMKTGSETPIGLVALLSNLSSNAIINTQIRLNALENCSVGSLILQVLSSIRNYPVL